MLTHVDGSGDTEMSQAAVQLMAAGLFESLQNKFAYSRSHK